MTACTYLANWVDLGLYTEVLEKSGLEVNYTVLLSKKGKQSFFGKDLDLVSLTRI